jgi:hypothetical protein
MDPRLREFFRQLMTNAINSGIASIFWKMPLLWTVVIVAILIGLVVYFGFY